MPAVLKAAFTNVESNEPHLRRGSVASTFHLVSPSGKHIPWCWIPISPLLSFQCIPAAYVDCNVETYFNMYVQTGRAITSCVFAVYSDLTIQLILKTGHSCVCWWWSWRWWFPFSHHHGITAILVNIQPVTPVAKWAGLFHDELLVLACLFMPKLSWG